MPIVTFHVGGGVTEAQSKRLLSEASSIYSVVLDAPIERVRAFLTRYAPSDVAVGGRALGEHEGIVFFEFMVLEGRPTEQHATLMELFTELAEEVLNVPAQQIRGCCHTIPPERWGIAGRLASEVRAAEIAQRQAGNP